MFEKDFLNSALGQKDPHICKEECGMDEPCSNITKEEGRFQCSIIRTLKKKGSSTHYYKEYDEQKCRWFFKNGAERTDKIPSNAIISEAKQSMFKIKLKNSKVNVIKMNAAIDIAVTNGEEIIPIELKIGRWETLKEVELSNNVYSTAEEHDTKGQIFTDVIKSIRHVINHNINMAYFIMHFDSEESRDKILEYYSSLGENWSVILEDYKKNRKNDWPLTYFWGGFFSEINKKINSDNSIYLDLSVLNNKLENQLQNEPGQNEDPNNIWKYSKGELIKDLKGRIEINILKTHEDFLIFAFNKFKYISVDNEEYSWKLGSSSDYSIGDIDQMLKRGGNPPCLITGVTITEFHDRIIVLYGKTKIDCIHDMGEDWKPPRGGELDLILGYDEARNEIVILNYRKSKEGIDANWEGPNSYCSTT